MRDTLLSKLRKYRSILLFFGTLCWFLWWTSHNPSPDGYQNEYLHVGNSYDLWDALTSADWWHLRFFMYTGYWPFGFYVLSWPTLLFGRGLFALLLGNIWLLGIMVYLFHKRGYFLPLFLLLLCPAVFGSLVRYEPNFANIVCMSIGIFALYQGKLESKKSAILWGVALGVGLMVDRLTLAFFLGPAVLPFLWKAPKRIWKNFAWGCGCVLLLTFAYYREFFLRHSEEIFPQVVQGEINAAGMQEDIENPISGLYYIFSLIDAQAGPFIGIVMLISLAAALWKKRKSRSDWMLIFSFVPAFLFFSIIAKKQVFYTIPALVPLALLCSNTRLAYMGIVGGFLGFASLGCGIGTIGTPFLPRAWVSPQHTLARPPTLEDWPYEDLFASFSSKPQEILVLSEDQQLYEGFLILRVREEFPEAHVRGVVLDPIGSVEFIRRVDYFVWMTDSSDAWPSVGGIQAELISDHYALDALPDVAKKVASLQSQFTNIFSQEAEDGTLHVFRRKQ